MVLAAASLLPTTIVEMVAVVVVSNDVVGTVEVDGDKEVEKVVEVEVEVVVTEYRLVWTVVVDVGMVDVWVLAGHISFGTGVRCSELLTWC